MMLMWLIHRIFILLKIILCMLLLGMEWRNDAHHIEITSSSQKVLLVADHQNFITRSFNAYEYVLQDLVQNKLINKRKNG